MTERSHQDILLTAMRLSPTPLDDDQLSERTGIRPRQQVNQICRRLQRAGVVRRYEGPDGKLVSELIAGVDPVVAAVVASVPSQDLQEAADPAADPTEHRLPPGASGEQRAAERVMLDLLGERLSQVLRPARIRLPSGVRVEVDGADPDRTTLVECWAHQGTVKSAQRSKVLADAFKLSWVATSIYPRPRLVLCLSDPAAAAPFVSTRSWPAQALRDTGIEVVVVELPTGIPQQIEAAQQRQFR